MMNIPLFIGLQPSQVVQDFFHQQYLSHSNHATHLPDCNSINAEVQLLGPSRLQDKSPKPQGSKIRTLESLILVVFVWSTRLCKSSTLLYLMILSSTQLNFINGSGILSLAKKHISRGVSKSSSTLWTVSNIMKPHIILISRSPIIPLVLIVSNQKTSTKPLSICSHSLEPG